MADLELYSRFEETAPIDENNSGYNLSPATAMLAFQPRWNLGGDDGHYDFMEWLVNYFRHYYPYEYVKILRGFDLAGAYLGDQADPRKKYNPWVYFALEKYNLAMDNDQEDQGVDEPFDVGIDDNAVDIDLDEDATPSDEMEYFWENFSAEHNLQPNLNVWS